MKDERDALSHPDQPLGLDPAGTIRFKENKLVSTLLKLASKKGIGLNELADMPFSNEDWIQFEQLTGYSHDGFADLSFVPDEVVERTMLAYEARKGSPTERAPSPAGVDELRTALEFACSEVLLAARHNGLPLPEGMTDDEQARELAEQFIEAARKGKEVQATEGADK